MSHANVDPREIERFAALAPRWWDPDGPMRALHELNPVRMAYVAERAPLAGRRVADIGCGGGLASAAMARAGARVTAVDLAGDAIAVAKLHALESGLTIDYRVAAAEDLAAAEPEGFDVVTCFELIEHVPDPLSLLRACASLLKPGGQLFVSTLNRTPKAFALGIVAAEYLLGLIPRGTHRYAQFVKPSELRYALSDCGLEVLDYAGLDYDPLSRRARLDHDLSINYLCHARRPPE
jgi:2-polyprenyl-6-hydroxyphenyl methylase/3-demethylubiquinone-9 3-methyltransferase